MAGLGKAATPQRHEHEQAPPWMVPVPATMVPELAEVVAAATETVEDLDAAPLTMAAVARAVPF